MMTIEIARGHPPSEKKIELSRILYTEVSAFWTNKLYSNNTYSAQNGDSDAGPRELW